MKIDGFIIVIAILSYLKISRKISMFNDIMAFVTNISIRAGLRILFTNSPANLYHRKPSTYLIDYQNRLLLLLDLKVRYF